MAHLAPASTVIDRPSTQVLGKTIWKSHTSGIVIIIHHPNTGIFKSGLHPLRMQRSSHSGGTIAIK